MSFLLVIENNRMRVARAAAATELVRTCSCCLLPLLLLFVAWDEK